MVYINLGLMDLLKETNLEYRVKITQVLSLSPVDQRLVDKLLLVFKVAVINM
jgi:hypothetical protein